MRPDPSYPHVVIVGAGFGGLRTAQALATAAVNVTIIDRSNHHLFQPLLYQVATASLSPADIASPIRSILRDQENAEVLMAEVTGVDTERGWVLMNDRSVKYDYLVLATGARHGYFGRDEWEAFAPGLKAIPDATTIRQKILYAFEAAEMELLPEKRVELLTFVLVGGGPTGVEMAGAIAELAQRALVSDFRRINPKTAKVILVEAGPRILTSFPEELSNKAVESLQNLGVEVRTNTRVENIDAQGVWINGECLRSHNVMWTAGVVASRAGKWVGAKTDKVGKVLVEKDLTLPGNPKIFVIGDTASVNGKNGKPLPGVAPVAMQQGRYVAATLRRRLEGATEVPPFRYVDKGNLATIGRSSAICDMGTIRLSGVIAWLAWLVVHIYYLIGFRNRLLVMIQWAFSYLTFHRGARLILPKTSE